MFEKMQNISPAAGILAVATEEKRRFRVFPVP